jgi:hypothetical protein
MAVHRRVGTAPPKPHESRPETEPRLGWTHRRPDSPDPVEVLELFTTPPYPARASESVGTSFIVSGGGFITATIESAYVQAIVVGGSLVQTFFPIDYTYRIDGGDDWEAATVGAAISAGSLGVSYIPVDYTYRREDADPHEDVAVSADIISGQLGGTYDPVNYLNWPSEGIEVGCEFTEGSLQAT